MVMGIALATFSILYLFSVVTNLQMNNKYAMQDITNQNPNYMQFTVSTKTIDLPVTRDISKLLSKLDGIEKSYYYEDMSYHLWQYEYLAPWIEWDKKLLIEMQPILLDVTEAQEYGLDKKVIYGKYFSGDPNEIIISLELFNRFVAKSSVIQDNISIIPESYRASLKKGNGTKINPQDLIGQVVPFMYAIDFGEKFPEMKSLNSVPLKVVGIFDPGIGYQTQGDVWLPLTLKSSLSKLDVTSPATSASGKMTVRINDDSFSSGFIESMDNSGYFVTRSYQLDGSDKTQLSRLKVQQVFYSYGYITAVIISLVSFIVICFLVISGRKYELILQRALGLTKQKMFLLFSLEMCIISAIGTIFGLFSVLVLINCGNKLLFHTNYYLPGDITLLVVGAVPLIVTGISYVLIRYTIRTNIAISLARRE
jgi:ABC-type antimicrobial peptide transport system permease subunit